MNIYIFLTKKRSWLNRKSKKRLVHFDEENIGEDSEIKRIELNLKSGTSIHLGKLLNINNKMLIII